MVRLQYKPVLTNDQFCQWSLYGGRISLVGIELECRVEGHGLGAEPILRILR